MSKNNKTYIIYFVDLCSCIMQRCSNSENSTTLVKITRHFVYIRFIVWCVRASTNATATWLTSSKLSINLPDTRTIWQCVPPTSAHCSVADPSVFVFVFMRRVCLHMEQFHPVMMCGLFGRETVEIVPVGASSWFLPAQMWTFCLTGRSRGGGGRKCRWVRTLPPSESCGWARIHIVALRVSEWNQQIKRIRNNLYDPYRERETLGLLQPGVYVCFCLQAKCVTNNPLDSLELSWGLSQEK